MPTLQRSYLFLFTFFGLSLISAANPTYPETALPELSTLLDKAREHSPTLVAQAIAREESVARLDAARAAYYPRLDLYSTIGVRHVTYDAAGVNDDTTAGANFNAVIRRPLYHWGAIEARIRQARLDQTNEDLQRVLILRQIKRGLRANYLNLLVNQASLEQLRLRRELASTQISRLTSDQAAGLVSSLEASQLALDQEQVLLDIETVEAEQRRILATFKREIGWDQPLALDQPVPKPNPEVLTAWIQQTHSRQTSTWTQDHAEVKRRLNLIEREKAELTWIKSRQRPLLNLAASAGRDQRSVQDDNNADALTYFAGIEVSWNVFDGFETSARTREANARLRRIERQLEAFRAELNAQANSVLDQIEFLLRRSILEEKLSTAVAEALRSAERDAAEGRLSAQALRQRQIAAQDAALNLLRSRVALQLALTDYLDLTLPVAMEMTDTPRS